MNAITKTNETATAVAAQKPKGLGEQLKDRESQFKAALPAHMPVERFMRVVMTAVQNNPDLQRADKPTFFNSCMRAAQDGLLPDGREGALVIYNTKIKEDGKDIWIKAVQWMPMIAGLRKKVRNSGEIKDWNAQVVFAKDDFEFELGDQPFIKHRPFMGAGDPGPVVAAYSVAQFKSGELSREVMTRAQLDRVRNASKSKDKGPWLDWFEEMCRKTVARRHSKVLPMSTDLDDLLRQDDDLYDMEGKSDKRLAAPPKSLGERLDMLAGDVQPKILDAETGEPEAPDVDIADDREFTPTNNTPSGPKPDATAASSPHAVEAGAAASQPPQKAAASDLSKAAAEQDRRVALRADLTRQGDQHAAAGTRALGEWLDELTGEEMAVLTAAQVKAWRNEAARAPG